VSGAADPGYRVQGAAKWASKLTLETPPSPPKNFLYSAFVKMLR